MKHNLNGNRYEIVYVDELIDEDKEECYGLCDAPTEPNKKIRIKRGLPSDMLLNVALHECLHGCLWCLSEDTVEQVATDLSKMLIKELGIEKAPASPNGN